MKTIKSMCSIRNLGILILFISLSSCFSISTFNQHMYTQTTSIKVDALRIMDLATQDFDIHKEKVNELQINLQKIYEYEKNRRKNKITLQLWDKLLNSEGHLLGGFLKRWEKEGKLGSTFTKEAKSLVDEAFDVISGLESKKLRARNL